MKPSELLEYLKYSISFHDPCLVTGPPGIGKSEIVKQACVETGVKLIVSHPVVSDPTDYKGLPFPSKDRKSAEFLPYGDLEQLVNAREETVFFLDDFGQASTSVQAACMQPILARRINGHKISDKVTFIGATNRKKDKAGVTGLIQPLKSRFTIQELTVDEKDWARWAALNDMPDELIAFILFQPDLLFSDELTTEIVNSSCPRTIASVGRHQKNCPKSLFEYACLGSAGIVFTKQYIEFLNLFNNLPTVDSVIADPSGAIIPPTADSKYAFMVSLARRMDEDNIISICKYLERFPAELNVCCMKLATYRNHQLKNTRAFIQWGTQSGNNIF